MKAVLKWIALALIPLSVVAQSGRKKYPIGGSAPNGERLKVAADLDARLAKWRRTPMPFNRQHLTPREVLMVQKLVVACQYLDDIYWRQSDPDGLTLYKQLEGSARPRDQQLLRLMTVNGSRWDLFDGEKPFVGSDPMPRGRAFYPPVLTQAQIATYVQAHPDAKNAIYDEHTVIRQQGSDLQAIPYHVMYRSLLEPAAKALREAAALSNDKSFAEFLRNRADALLSDDYYASDVAWLDLERPKIDVIFAPYETYLDGLLGVKTTYGAAVLIRNEAESKKLDLFEKYVPQLQDSLPLANEDKPSKEEQRMPMEVVDAPFRGGDLDHGYQAVADNLPNNARIHAEKGTKKIFFKNFMDARVNYVVLPMAKLVMNPAQAAKVTGDGYLADTLMHEIAHGLGPAFARVNGKQVSIREAIGSTFSGLEEAKADSVGLLDLQWMMDHGYMPKENAEEYYVSHVADLFRSMRFGPGEAHSSAETMEFNYFVEQGAVRREATGRYTVDMSKIPAVNAALAKELLAIEATGDRDRAEKWFARYAKYPDELTKALEPAKNVPIDIEPVFSFPSKVQ